MTGVGKSDHACCLTETEAVAPLVLLTDRKVLIMKKRKKIKKATPPGYVVGHDCTDVRDIKLNSGLRLADEAG
jgi:hypothetical protein